ncbi:MAG: recombination protein RecR [Clostridia bacterium]|nr:recombination protein RecR [Clostridia bacterium]
MSVYGASVTKLIEKFESLPGVGHKSAERMAFFLMRKSEDDVRDFAQAIYDARKQLKFCTVCQNMSDKDVCDICSNAARNRGVICVVQEPKDVQAIERSREFDGTYHVLHGAISPMNGIGPDDIRIKELLGRLDGSVNEVIVATNSDVEGEATAMYIARLIKPLGVKVTRIARGLPVGGDLEYADDVTLGAALQHRVEI